MGGDVYEVETRAGRPRRARGALVLLVVGGLAAALGGCNTRVRQCNALIDVVNAEQDGVVQAVNRVGPRPEAGPIEALARSFDSAVSRVSAVPVADAGLHDRKVALQGVLRRFASVIGEMATAARNNEAAEYNARRGELNGLNGQLTTAVDSVNAYCGR